MKISLLHSLIAVSFSGGLSILLGTLPLAMLAMPAPEPQGAFSVSGEPLELDRALVDGLSKGNPAALERIEDPDFSWINAQGVSMARLDVVSAITTGKGPKPLLGSDVQTDKVTYGANVTVLHGHKDKSHTMHIWVKRPIGWRLLNISEIVEYAAVPYGGTTINATCVNPCEKVPFVPGNGTQAAVMASWQEQQTGPEGWLKRVAPNQIAYSTNGTRTRDSRIEVMNQQKASGASIAAPPLLWARIWDFDDAAVMISIQQGNNAKAFWGSRVFYKRNGNWEMVESYQTYIQDAVTMLTGPSDAKH
jgi:hypothetical protein